MSDLRSKTKKVRNQKVSLHLTSPVITNSNHNQEERVGSGHKNGEFIYNPLVL